MVGVQVGTGGGGQAVPVLAQPVLALLLAGRTAEVGRGAAHVVDVALERGVFGHELGLGEQRLVATRLDDAALVEVERAKRAIAHATAIAREREIMAPVTETAHVLDTTRLLPSQLRRWVQQFVKQPAAKLTLTFESFGYKRGLPYASDLVFDVRCLPNPYYSPELRPLTGLDAPVASYLAQEPLVSEMIDDIAAFIAKWLPHYRGQNRHYLTICIGCTGGQHRSVYVAEMLGRRFADQAGTIVRHRALSANLLPENKLQTL